jgi:hypothetical protein
MKRTAPDRSEKPLSATARRQQRLRDRYAASGIETCSLLVPRVHCQALRAMAKLMRDNPALTIGTLRDTQSGKLVSLEPDRRRRAPDKAERRAARRAARRSPDPS